jgi:hypothetical protein
MQLCHQENTATQTARISHGGNRERELLPWSRIGWNASRNHYRRIVVRLHERVGWKINAHVP